MIEPMRSTGRSGERIAARHLARRGWRILDRNWRGGGGELDLVALRLGTIAFVEVKSRADPGALTEPVRAAQRNRLVRAASAYLARRPELAAACARFDVIAIEWRDGRPAVTHLADAFQVPAPAVSASKSRSSVYATDRNDRRWIGVRPDERSAS